MADRTIEVALLVAGALESCGAQYLVGGSLASSFSGEPRSTLDIDLVIDLTADRISQFVAALGDDFYADVASIRRAVRETSSTNLIHLPTSMKIDLFALGGSKLETQQMKRRQRLQVATNPDQYLFVYTAEDILLQKLRWYRLGDEVSDRQWRDIIGIVAVQQDQLDVAYLLRHAEALGLSDLLERALESRRGEG